MKYWVAIQREVQNYILNEKDETQELEDVNRVIADIEVIEMVGECVNNNNVIDMNTVKLTYNALLDNEEDINFKVDMLNHFYKTMLQMFYFQDLRVENPRISIVTSFTKTWSMITPTKLTILLEFLKWQKFCEGIL